jgi:Uri superfamily endonuclease
MKIIVKLEPIKTLDDFNELIEMLHKAIKYLATKPETRDLSLNFEILEKHLSKLLTTSSSLEEIVISDEDDVSTLFQLAGLIDLGLVQTLNANVINFLKKVQQQIIGQKRYETT